MRRRLGNALSASLLTGLALITILGLLDTSGGALSVMADFLLQLVAVVAAFAVLVGVFNLLVSIHLRRWLRFQRGWFYSLITVASAVGVIVVYGLDRNDSWTGDLAGEELSPRVFRVAQIAIESALAGLILFFLVYAAYRLMRNRVTWANTLFVTAILIVLFGWLPIEGFELVADLRDWLLGVPVTSGTRGLLIGIGLGTIAVALRILLAQERLYHVDRMNHE